MVQQIGKDAFISLEKKYNNEYLEDLLMNKAHFDKVYRGEDQLIQKKDPILMRPYSTTGRAHFYAPYKVLGTLEIPTFIFNLAFIWLMILILYLTLLNNTLKKIIQFFESPPGKLDEQGTSTFRRLINVCIVLLNYPRVYLRARRMKGAK
ncbi:MAG: hypothetical protein AAF551_04310 [Bacteroidota bacterium]